MTQESDDIQRHERASDADAKLDDHNTELSETKAGYLYVSGASDRESRSDARDNKARKADTQLVQLSALQQFLSDPEYVRAHNQARDTIVDFKEHMAEQLESLENKIEAIDEKLNGVTPGSPEHKRLMREREAYQRKQQELLDYYNDTVRPIEVRMNDPDNPPTKAELDEFNRKVNRDMNNAFTPPSEASEHASSVRTVNLEVPTL